jgi:UDP-2,4-diacetamido-2,4,6-trideoxy-beta-L-altropyranose hydrolase
MPAPFAVFRADGGPQLGGGHIARCLTLADELRKRGWTCAFAVSDETAVTLPGLAKAGHAVLTLPAVLAPETEAATLAAHWRDGADLLVVDHYKRDSGFEAPCRPWAKKIVVFDDLADRPHDCDLLLDPTLGRKSAQYRGAVSATCIMLLGPEYALLRPEFAAARPTTLARRQTPELRRVLISFGSTDPVDASGACLDVFKQYGFDVAVDVVLGAAAPRLERVRKQVAALPRAKLHVETQEMAKLMAEADWALGAAGATSWERCCLGLPAFVSILAPNQVTIASALAAAGAVRVAGPWHPVLAERMVRELTLLTPARMAPMIAAAAAICDGSGIFRVAEAIERLRSGAA